MYPAPTRCPACGGTLAVRELACETCDTSVRGRFEGRSCHYCTLDAKQSEFLEVFLRHRGVLTSIGDELKISYPTVRSRLDALLFALGMSPAPERDEASQKRKTEIIEKLERGELSADEAKKALRETR